MNGIILLDLVIAFLACIFVWMFFSLRQILRCKEDMEKANRQLTLYHMQQASVQNETEAILRRQQVEISEEIYRSAIAVYHHTLQKPMNRVPAYILGLRPAESEGKT
jgi:hypothetical protein